MEISRRISRLAGIVAAVLIGTAGISMHGVTTKEMEQAKATAALWYLRYANDGSDYLEKLNPATVGELEKSLKAKEKENIKAFKAVKTPSDYSGWDKEKLVEYWTVTFFKSPGLSEKGVIARSRVRKKLSAMSVSAPAPETPAPAQEVGGEAPQLPESAPVDGVNGEKPAADTATPALPSAEQVIEDAGQLEDSLALASDMASKAKSEGEKSNGSTWIYVVVLLLLVGVVVWLVIFASKTMQNQNRPDADTESPRDKETDKRHNKRSEGARAVMPVEEEDEEIVVATRIKSDAGLREKFARSLAQKDEEINGLQREIHGLREECLRLGEENGRLSSDLASANREVEALRGRLKAATAVTSATAGRVNPRAQVPADASDVEVNARPVASRPAPRPASETSEIYLGRVNSKGLFVRADRQPVEGKSMYVLVTQDGFTGSYRVLQRPAAIEMGLENPGHYLAGGCFAIDIEDTEGATSIRTLSAGTAIFEEGCWRVLRKARIEYVD